MFLKRMPLKCKNMAEKQDIAMNEFPINNVADYLYTEKGNNQQKVTPTDMLKDYGILRLFKRLEPGEAYELPYGSGLMMVQNTSETHQKAIAAVYEDNTGKVIVPQTIINFFSEVEGRICIFNKGVGTKYVVKNSRSVIQNVVLTFIS